MMRKKISVIVVIAIIYGFFYQGANLWGRQFAIADELSGPFNYSWIVQYGFWVLIGMGAVLTIIGLLQVAYNVYHPENKKSWRIYMALMMIFCVLGAGIMVTAEKELKPYMSQLGVASSKVIFHDK